MSLAGPDIMEPTTKFNNYRIYGTFLLVSVKIIDDDTKEGSKHFCIL